MYATPAASVGFLGADVYDANRASLNALAFQAVGQTERVLRRFDLRD